MSAKAKVPAMDLPPGAITPAAAPVAAPAPVAQAKIGLCVAIALVAGLALGLVIGVAVDKPSVVTALPVAMRAPTAYISLQNSTLTWNGRVYGYRKLMNATGKPIETISGVPTYIIASTDSMFRVFYRNLLSEQTIIHAHGMTPPWTFDGVPFLSAAPLYPGDEQLYSFALTEQNAGTYFLHAHFDVHHGQGMAMPLIVRQPPPMGYPESVAGAINRAQDVILMLNEFCPFYNGPDGDIAVNATNPDCRDAPVMQAVELEMQRRAGDNSSMAEECLAPAERLAVRWRAHMANGRFLEDPMTVTVAADVEYVRLRIINSASQSNYLLDFAGLSATIIATDGGFIRPLATTALPGGLVWVGVSQRLDVLLHIPVDVLPTASHVVISARDESDGYSLRAGIVLYRGATAPTAAAIRNSVGPVNTSAAGWWRDMGFEAALSAFTPLSDLTRAPDRSFDVVLSGYHGTVNGRTYVEYPVAPFRRNPSPLRVRYGERVHITIVNRTPEPHAMHLHGHHFQILAVDGQPINGGGAIRDSLVLPAGCHNSTIVFDALNPGIHEFHCHMAYDMMAGMITTVEYIPSDFDENTFTPAEPGGHGGGH